MNKNNILKIYTKEKQGKIGDMFGIFFEDLNHAADGGLYAELVQNPSFEFAPIDNPDYHSLTAWEKVEPIGGKVEIYVEETNPLNTKNTHYLVINAIEPGEGVGIKNLGFNTGIPLTQGESYKFSCYARLGSNFVHPVQITLESGEGEVYAAAKL